MSCIVAGAQHDRRVIRRDLCVGLHSVSGSFAGRSVLAAADAAAGGVGCCGLQNPAARRSFEVAEGGGLDECAGRVIYGFGSGGCLASCGVRWMKHLLAKLVDGQALDVEEAVEAFELIMTGQSEPAQTGALLAMMQLRGVRESEMLGAAKVMREKAVRVEVPQGLTVIDTCGTGGDHAGTFNISTAAAIVAAGAIRPHGCAVAKHGNRSVTSHSGSSQVLETLGVKLEVHGEVLTQCLDEAGMAFCFAPLHHPAMKHAGPIRQQLGFRTLFNIVGPLTNPAGARRQVMGVFDPDLLEPIGQVLVGLGAERAMVVYGQVPEPDHVIGGLDELSICGLSRVIHVQDGQLREMTVDAAELGLPLALPSSLKADGPQDSARIIRSVLDNEDGPAKDVTMLNAAAAIIVSGVTDEFDSALMLAHASIEKGAARAVLDKLISLTQG